MHRAKALRINAFGADDPLSKIGDSTQVDYLRCYLHDLGATWVVEEPHYFDRDYLDEFAAFYATSARGYPNICRRLTFFAVEGVGTPAAFRRLLTQAAAGDNGAVATLRDRFLAFVVVRPIPGAPLGRTVVRWYPERPNTLPRVTSPRRYGLHVAGIELHVDGLAWQQQDSAVGACATIGIWTMLHSSAFDEHLAVPTTASVTRAAHRTASLGDRVFPSSGLSNFQLLEAIKEHGLSPLVLEGEIRNDGRPVGFSVERFSTSCAALLRSGYPVLLSGKRVPADAEDDHTGEGHVMCAVGFRPLPATTLETGVVALDDARLEHLFVHDDALGPSARFAIKEGDCAEAVLTPDAPPPRRPGRPVQDPSVNVDPFIPMEIIVAVHNDVRISPDHVHSHALVHMQDLATFIAESPKGLPRPGLGMSIRFVRLSEYLGDVLAETVGHGPALARTRLALCEKVAPMSLHLAVVRLGVAGLALLDVLYDTTDSTANLSAFAHVVFDREIADIMKSAYEDDSSFGARVRAYT